MSLKLKIDGFDDLLRDIERAGGNLDAIMGKCLRESAEIMQNELKTQMRESRVPNSMIDAMPEPELEKDYGVLTARVGYKKGAFDPKNPSIGYKVVFLNYGTPYRTKHGKVKERGFIQRAKKRAMPKIRKQQEKALQEDLKGLKKCILL